MQVSGSAIQNKSLSVRERVYVCKEAYLGSSCAHVFGGGAAFSPAFLSTSFAAILLPARRLLLHVQLDREVDVSVHLSYLSADRREALSDAA